MTKAERLTLTTMTAEAWRTLHLEELDNARSATLTRRIESWLLTDLKLLQP